VGKRRRRAPRKSLPFTGHGGGCKRGGLQLLTIRKKRMRPPTKCRPEGKKSHLILFRKENHPGDRQGTDDPKKKKRDKGKKKNQTKNPRHFRGIK